MAVDIEKADANSVLGQLLPVFVKEFNLATVRADVKQKEADDLCRRLMDASSSVFGLQGERLKQEQLLVEMKAKLLCCTSVPCCTDLCK